MDFLLCLAASHWCIFVFYTELCADATRARCEHCDLYDWSTMSTETQSSGKSNLYNNNNHIPSQSFSRRTFWLLAYPLPTLVKNLYFLILMPIWFFHLGRGRGQGRVNTFACARLQNAFSALAQLWTGNHEVEGLNPAKDTD